jgi:hypothetical protein
MKCAGHISKIGSRGQCELDPVKVDDLGIHVHTPRRKIYPKENSKTSG